jgi:AraC family transcriptional regulator of adaptative response / DNA-3-methyladenine glycosylase II
VISACAGTSAATTKLSETRQSSGQKHLHHGVEMTDLDFDQCYQATSSRDARFDGRFIVGVRTTRVYCRPSCPSPVCPKPKNVTFYRSTAAAQQAGLRACKRCSPDAVPGSPEWNSRGDVVSRGMRLIADGVVDREGVAGVARRLDVSVRHLHRLLVADVGAPPLALARAQRAQTARVLIERTTMPLTEVSFGAGFSSIRQFNDTIRAVYGFTPSGMREMRKRTPSPNAALTLRLTTRRPFDGRGVLEWLAARAVPGLEEVVGATYRRSLLLPGGAGVVELTPGLDHVQATLHLATVADLPAAVHRCRRLFDLDADPAAYADLLSRDAALAPLVAANPGLRVPGCVDGAESAARAVLGQQVSLAAARTFAGRLVAAYGVRLPEPVGTVTHAFPMADTLAGVDLGGVGLPSSRRETMRALSRAISEGSIALDGSADRVETRDRLLDIPGIGEWTATYIALRALGDPDAFPASDHGIRRGARRLQLPDAPAALSQRAEAWRPWRAYAAHYLWSVNR